MGYVRLLLKIVRSVLRYCVLVMRCIGVGVFVDFGFGFVVIIGEMDGVGFFVIIVDDV